ncbi:MAG TPA: hypothetical protein VGM37_12190 [Armatimonadota bacterium]|jgi:hypothetical protein
MRRVLLLILALCICAGPAAARRYRHRARRPARVTLARRAAPARAVRNVIIVVADGYSPDDWRRARDAAPNHVLNLDRMPVTGVAVAPGGASTGSLARILGTGSQPNEQWDPPMLPVLGAAKQAGKSVALVGGGGAADPMPAFLAVPDDGQPAEQTLNRLRAARIDVLFARTLPESAPPAIGAAALRPSVSPAEALLTETTPALAAAAPADASFEQLCFRALHLAAKGKQGFFLAATATPEQASAADLDAALAPLALYARNDRRTLILVVARYADAANLFAGGMSETKFMGTLALTDIPKILAGICNLRGFRRDFSPLFTSHATPPAAPAITSNGLSLPW